MKFIRKRLCMIAALPVLCLAVTAAESSADTIERYAVMTGENSVYLVQIGDGQIIETGIDLRTLRDAEVKYLRSGVILEGKIELTRFFENFDS